MWVKYLWVCLVTGAVVAAAVHDTPRELNQPSWPLQRFYFAGQHPFLQVQDDYDDSWRGKRTGPSLSVSNPIEVLRSRLLLEIARRRMQKMDDQQISKNKDFLKSVGKRQIPYRTTDQNTPKTLDFLSNSGDFEWDTS